MGTIVDTSKIYSRMNGAGGFASPKQTEFKPFKYVYIPCDSDTPMEERIFDQPMTLENDLFVESLRKHFSTNSNNVDTKLLKSQMMEHNADAVKGLDSMTPEAIAAFASMSTVEIFPITLPTKDSDFAGVNIYIDDKGVSKKLDVNQRATQMVRACGYGPDHTMHGDAFLSRVRDDMKDVWERTDFLLAECNSDSAWVKQCLETKSKKQGSEYQAQLESLKSTMGDVNLGRSEAGSQQTDKYKWQDVDEDEAEVEIFLPESLATVTKHDVSVVFGQRELRVSVRGEVLFEEELEGVLDRLSCCWTFTTPAQTKNRNIQITLIKQNSASWSRL